VRSDGLVTHLGGDDFGVLVKGLNDTKSANLIAQNLLVVLQQPMSLEDTPGFFAPCMGLSLWPTGSEDGEGLLRDANMAVFRARLSHLDSVCVYSSQIAREVKERSQKDSTSVILYRHRSWLLFWQEKMPGVADIRV
jgi:predicted signal transduction protein with EAL and GGDEF domain